MKIMLAMGSPRQNGNTSVLSHEFVRLAVERGHEIIYLDLNIRQIKPCQGCTFCTKHGRCYIKDDIADDILENVDALVFASPIYFFSFTAQTKLFMDRLYSKNLKDVKIASIITSGSIGYFGGADIMIDILQRVCEYCYAIFKGVFHKCTGDVILPLTDEDSKNLSLLLDSLEDKSAHSTFLGGI